MKGFLGDLLRAAVALLYWNARKTAYRLGGASGRCPCQNPSDSGEPMQTGCEAVVHWERPERFQRVCPLLARNAEGEWVCSVAEQDVRPFWGRAIVAYGTVMVAAVLLAGLAAFGLMRGIGYPVSLRQVLWPPAWRELRVVRSELFIAQARRDFAAGRVREAVSALATAREYDPGNYAVGMLLAQFYQAGQPSAADELYRVMLTEHPEKADGTAEAWFRSLLARGRFRELCLLAQQRLVAGNQQPAAWTHAILFSSRMARQAGWLEQALALPALAPPAAELLRLELRLNSLASPAERQRLLREAPLPEGFPYAWAHRASRFIEEGHPDDALRLLREAKQRNALGGRDLVRLALAAYAANGQSGMLEREVDALLERNGAAEVEIVALHLLNHPDDALRGKLLEVALQPPADAGETWRAATLTAYCLAAIAGDEQSAGVLRDRLRSGAHGVQGGLTQLEVFLGKQRQAQGLLIVLPYVQPLPVDLNYALLEKYLEIGSGKGIRP